MTSSCKIFFDSVPLKPETAGKDGSSQNAASTMLRFDSSQDSGGPQTGSGTFEWSI